MPTGADAAAVFAHWGPIIHPVTVLDSIHDARVAYQRERHQLVPVSASRATLGNLPVLDVVMYEPAALRTGTWRVVLAGPTSPISDGVQAAMRDWLDILRTASDARWALLGADHPDR